MRIKPICYGIIILGIAGCNGAAERAPAADQAVRIRIHPVTQKEILIPVRTTGLLATSSQMKLSFKTGGIVRQIHCREGQSVSRGEVLAALDLLEIDAQVEQARIGYEKAQRDLERAENLYRDSVVTLEQYQNARSALELAGTNREIAAFNLRHSKIMAPSDGTVQKILVETNEMIAPGYPAILFASTENDWVVRVALADKDIVKFSTGDSAAVHMDAFPGTPFSAEVTELGSVSDPVTGTYEVELRIPGSLPQFRTGFFCRVELFPAGPAAALVIPFESLLDASDNEAYVFVYESGSVSRKRVRTGPVREGMVVITEGISQGDRVVTEGASYLREGEEVVVIDTVKSTAE